MKAHVFVIAIQVCVQPFGLALLALGDVKAGFLVEAMGNGLSAAGAYLLRSGE